jgi:hypothetical protein
MDPGSTLIPGESYQHRYRRGNLPLHNPLLPLHYGGLACYISVYAMKTSVPLSLAFDLHIESQQDLEETGLHIACLHPFAEIT